MGFKLNLTKDEITQAQGGNFPVLPKGTYGAVVYNNVQKKSKSSGNPMFEIDYKIIEGPAGVGRRLRAWYVLLGKGLFKLVELNKATDFPYPNKETPAGEFEFPEPEEYVGKKVNIVIEQQDYEGVDAEGNDATLTRNQVRNVFPYDPDKISTEDDVESDDEDSGGFTL